MPSVDWKRGRLWVENGAILPGPDSVGSPNGYKRVYLLVHGFNNTRDKADESYRRFRKRIKDYIGPSLSHLIWEFYWPGYEERYGNLVTLLAGPAPAHSLVTAINYHKQVPKAVDFGKLLGEYMVQLRSDAQDTEFVLIGHSLGCRLILEALSSIENQIPKVKIAAILLMAAAVPVSAVELGGRLRSALESSQRRFAVFSHSDRVLSICFPMGQRLANDGGALPKAVGWHGMPFECWTDRQRTSLTHGQYWSDQATTPNVVRLFGKTTPHVLPYTFGSENQLPEAPATRDWKLRKWELPTL